MLMTDSVSLDFLRDAASLPAAGMSDAVCRTLASHGNLVVTAPPGAGKSTLLPLVILKALTDGGKVVMLEPRRLAARQVAERMAFMLGESVGQTVGYRIRFENCVSAATRVEVLTEGILTRRLMTDPTLEGVSVVIFDEFHERSLTSDVAFALTREAQQLLRPELKIVILSATIDATSLCDALQAPLVKGEGRMFPVDVRMAVPSAGSGRPIPEITSFAPSDVATAVAQTILMAHREHEGDILAFLPGEGEIRRCAEMLGTALGSTRICPLYGLLSSREQRMAIAPSAPGERKVVLATSIAETSITIEGVRVVIDSGLCRRMAFDVGSGLSHPVTVRVSQDMADQRSGRAGRVAPGICYRLWSPATAQRMEPFRKPEIEEADLAPMRLDVAVWGESHPEQLPWLTPPPSAHLAGAAQVLRWLDAVDAEGKVTAHGRQLAKLPCHPRLAQMLVMADSPARKALAADIAALLDERDPMARECDTADLTLRLDRLRTHPQRWPRISTAAEQYRRLAGQREGRGDEVDAREAGRLLALAWPERVAHVSDASSGRYRMANGEFALLAADDELSASEWIVVADMHAGGRIFLAAPVSPADLRMLVHERDNISWDARQGCAVARREQHIGCLVIASQPIADGNREEVVKVICEAAAKYGTTMFDFSEAVAGMQQRVATVAAWHPELELPDLSTDAVLSRAAEWLPYHIGKATTVSELRKTDLAVALWTLLTYEQQQVVDRLAPTHLTMPTGSRIRVEYRLGAELPILRVRLQECFGMAETPRVDGGQRPVLMELLSPGFKPVQLTQDLHSFWQTTYFEVRKELRRRYPKHAWPDNPMEAVPVRGVRRPG